MIEIELLILIFFNIVNIYLSYVNLKKSNHDVLRSIDEDAQTVSKKVFKPFAKKGKIKPVVNDDFKMWQNEQ